MTSALLEGPSSAGPASQEGRRPRRARRSKPRNTLTPGASLGLGIAMLWFSLLVLIPLTAVVVTAAEGGWTTYYDVLTNPQTWAAVTLTVQQAVLVTAINIVMGTVIAWVLVRDRFFGQRVIEFFIDIPFALPTIVAGLVLLSLYGPRSPIGLDISNTRTAVFVAFLFVTLPFVVRTVQPVLRELDRDMEQAAYSLGASPAYTFRRIILPNLAPAMISGGGLAFTRAIAEYGSTNLLTGSIPFSTQVSAVNIFGRIESDDTTAAAAISTVLLVVAFVVLIGLDLFQRWSARRG